MLQSASEKRNPSVQRQMIGDGIHSFAAGEAEAVDRPEHCLVKKSTAQKADRGRKISVATDIVMTKIVF